MRSRLALVPALLGTACAPLSIVSREPPRLFHLTPKSTFSRPMPKQPETLLLVDTVTATAGLNTARIAIKPTPTTLEYYAGATWLEVVPVMAHNLIVESFDNSGALDALPQGAIAARASYVLNLNIREFQAEYTGDGQPPDVLVRIDARLATLPRRDVIAVSTFQERLTASSTSLNAIIETFDEAFGEVIKELIYWAANELNA